jgi:hypothetical protein
MFYCPMCERDRDCHEFPKFFAGMRGKLCKSCHHILAKYPDDHWKVRKFENAGFQNETPATIRSRMLLIQRDKMIEEKRGRC